MYYDRDIINLILSYKKNIIDLEYNTQQIIDIFNSDEKIIEVDIDYILFRDILIENKNQLSNYNLIKYLYMDHYLHYSYYILPILCDINSKVIYDYTIKKIEKDSYNNIILYIEKKIENNFSKLKI